MKKTFADLHFRLNVKDPAATLPMINKAATLGYRLIAAPFAPEAREGEVSKLRAACNKIEIDFASRIDL